MPRVIAPGDANASRLEALRLLNTGEWGVPYGDRAFLEDLVVEKGQFFYENDARRRYFSKYGVLTTLLSIPPLLVDRFWGGERLSLSSDDRLVLILNSWQWLWGLALFYILVRLAREFGGEGLQPEIFAAASFFSTYLLFYLRAQTFEAVEAVFFAAGLLAFSRVAAGHRRAPPFLAGALFCLSLLKFYYVFLFPLAALLLFRRNPAGGALRVLGAGCAAALIVLGGVSAYKFGAPWETGYGQWVSEGEAYASFSPSYFPSAIKGYLASIRLSVFLYAPLLILSVLGWRNFRRKNTPQADFMLTTGVFFLALICCTRNWEGRVSYGPRLLFFVLPVLGIASIEGWRLLGAGGRVAAAAFLLFSTAMQGEVALWPFLAQDRFEGPFRALKVPEVDRYFESRLPAFVLRDLRRHRNGGDVFPPLSVVANVFPTETVRLERAGFERVLASWSPLNLFWFGNKKENA